MSGGSWDYFYRNLEEVAERLCGEAALDRKAFGRHLKLCAIALHDIEWTDSCDNSKGSESAAILKVLGGNAPVLILEEARSQAEFAFIILQNALNNLPPRAPQED